MSSKTISVLTLFISCTVYSQTAFTGVKAIPSDSADYFLQKGLIEKTNGRKMESLKNLEKAAKFDSTNKAVIAELSSAYLDMRKYYNAREMFKKLVSMGEESAANYKQLLQLSFQLKQNEDVLLYANKLKIADPNEKISFYIGKVQYDRENYGEAIKTLSKAAAEDSVNAEIPYMIAHSYADMMNYKMAVPYFQKAIELAPKQNYWVYELSMIFYAMNDDRNALKYMLEAGEKGYKRDNDYLENLGIAYLNVGELDKGVEILGEILKRKPSDLNILNMLAEAFYYKKKFDEAINYWDKILEYDKANASSLYMIGMAYQKKGGKENTNKGIALCDKAIEMDPALASLKQKKMTMGL
ncbi:MAG: tetratricopeptide repeat protein [Chitinophagaceae bacterium]|nr:tetratricopeptide repeat protein [Chitinophagaceae bacterium]